MQTAYSMPRHKMGCTREQLGYAPKVPKNDELIRERTKIYKERPTLIDLRLRWFDQFSQSPANVQSWGQLHDLHWHGETVADKVSLQCRVRTSLVLRATRDPTRTISRLTLLDVFEPHGARAGAK